MSRFLYKTMNSIVSEQEETFCSVWRTYQRRIPAGHVLWTESWKTNRNSMHMKETVSDIHPIFPTSLLLFKTHYLSLGPFLPQCCPTPIFLPPPRAHLSKTWPEHHCVSHPRWLFSTNLMRSKPPGLADEALHDVDPLTEWEGKRHPLWGKWEKGKPQLLLTQKISAPDTI